MRTNPTFPFPTSPAAGARSVGPSLAGIGALGLVAVLAACGSDDGSPTVDAAEPIEVTAIDYAFVDLPERVRAGSTLTLSNDSDEELHELVAVRLPDDEQRSVAELVQLPMEEFEPFFAGLETVLIAPPNESGIPVVGTGVLSTPGRYAVVCLIPTGADPDEYLNAANEGGDGPPEVDGGPPHIAHGMFGEIQVVD